MHETAREARSFRFGPFELAGGTGELRREGKRVSRLQAQPLQVLLMLLERAGEVVTRDELRQKVWSSDTFVDFDHGVNTAINKLRSALGESASSPRFIETLPRIGYRFIAGVEALDAGSLQSGGKPETKLPAQTAVTQALP
ncbi:MAG TPA: winged helix-turn-helix domain-containing protein, partial [Candidatus Acidoferrales bacterium]|nr:winged helix-turn-helix domain-containing protein [Candidatus Acidoferrales bacterium]